jgi:NADP-dependent 3-hydroxy acid dehydrogenase YdfG
MDELAGRVAVISGAASGIGYRIATALAGEGMRLVLADVDAAGLTSARRSLARAGAEVTEVLADVRDAAAVDALAAVAVETFGTVHVVYNNAGVWTLGYQWETSLDDWRWVVDVYLWGVIHGVRTFVPILLANPAGGHVVNTASMGGLLGGPVSGPYVATKHAVVGLSKGLRAELTARTRTPGLPTHMSCSGRRRFHDVRLVGMDVDEADRAAGFVDLGPGSAAQLPASRASTGAKVSISCWTTK